MRMNINEYVWVKLTDDGKKQLASKGSFAHREEDRGWHKFPMWELMEIFGSAMYMGGKSMFEAGDIYFTKPTGAKR